MDYVCKICGGKIKLLDDMAYAECEYCGEKFPLAELDSLSEEAQNSAVSEAETVTMHLSIGAEYKGRVSDGLPDGFGMADFGSGRVWKGTWSGGEPWNGYGYWPEFRLGELVGHFEGRIVDGRKSGRGRIDYLDGSSYEGEFAKGMPNGNGRFTEPDNDYYEGSWVDGKRCGHGIFISRFGVDYDGEWKNNERNGKGRNLYKNGLVWEGEFLADKQVPGEGKYYYRTDKK